MRNLSNHPLPNDALPKWFQSPVFFHKGSLSEIHRFIPEVERRSFGLTQESAPRSRLNERLDMIVRKPTGLDANHVPIGVVSKAYTLVPHTQVIEIIQKALPGIGLTMKDVSAQLHITEYGERMALSVFLPEKYQFDPGDGHPMALRLECRNSVDGTTGFKAFMGWFRFVCSNGLIIGVTRFNVRRRHVGNIGLKDVGRALNEGLRVSKEEKSNFMEWRRNMVDLDRIGAWADNDLRKSWGFKAAARAWHIATTGCDAAVIGPYKDHAPTTIAVENASHVPGAPARAANLYDISQVLAWLARDRRDLEEQLQWREQISELLKPLMN